jgi:hypothetical protein
VPRARREALILAHRAAEGPVHLRVMDIRRWYGAREFTPALGRHVEAVLESVALRASIRLVAYLPPETELRVNRVWTFTAGGYLIAPRLRPLTYRSRAGAALLCGGAAALLLAGAVLAAPALVLAGAARRMWITGARSPLVLPLLLVTLAAGAAVLWLDGTTVPGGALVAGSLCALAGAFLTFGWIGHPRGGADLDAL